MARRGDNFSMKMRSSRGAFGFGAHGSKALFDVAAIGATRMPLPPPPALACHHRIEQVFGDWDRVLDARDFADEAGTHETPACAAVFLRLDLSPMARMACAFGR